MWFRRKRDPWERIAENLVRSINFIDREAAGELVKQGEDDKAFQARLITIRLASMLEDQQVAEAMVTLAEQLLETQTTAGMTALQSNGHGDEGRQEERTRLEVRSQVGHCSIVNAAVRSI